MPSTPLRWLLGLIGPHWPRLTPAGALLIVTTLIGLALPWVVRDLVDSVFVTGDLARLNMLAVGLLALFAVQAALGVVAGYWLAQIGQRLVADLRRRVHDHLTALPLGFFARRPQRLRLARQQRRRRRRD